MPGEMTTLSVHDETLVKLAAQGASPEELSARTGMPAAQAVIRVKEILASKNVWTFIEQQQLLLEDIQRLKTEVFGFVDQAIANPDLLKAMISILQLIGDRLDRVKALVDEEDEKQTKKQAKMIGEFFMGVWEPVRQHLATKHSPTEIDEIDELFYKSVEDTVADYLA